MFLSVYGQGNIAVQDKKDDQNPC